MIGEVKWLAWAVLESSRIVLDVDHIKKKHKPKTPTTTKSQLTAYTQKRKVHGLRDQRSKGKAADVETVR